MKITLAKSAGFCFGVRRALTLAFNTLKKTRNIEILGDIVHNETVAAMIKAAGIRKIKKLVYGKGKTLLIRAHGAAKSTLIRAKDIGYTVIDATCPKVKEIHKIASNMEKKGYKIIIIGDKNHDEVQGIIGQLLSKPVVIHNIKSITKLFIKGIKKAAVVSQSTQELNSVLEIIGILEKNIPQIKFFNTICQPTRLKQKEIERMPMENDIMLIIGSKTSANTKRLFNISKRLNKKSYWIQSESDINPRWFKDAKSVGITAGASTPDATTQNVITRIKGLT